jgi:S-disulfanyl-L-cysteine oxidoreductase SoxD
MPRRHLWIPLALLTACSPSGQRGGSGQRYGIGRAATAQEIAALDVDIGPDGAGLPPGKGSAADGAVLYAAKCANCHGDKGQGMAPGFPALIGRDPAGEKFEFANDYKIARTIGNYWANATSLFDYLRRAMPHTMPGSLRNDEVYALVAHLLAENHIIPPTATLDSAALMQVKMPAAGHFVTDDRRGGSKVR